MESRTITMRDVIHALDNLKFRITVGRCDDKEIEETLIENIGYLALMDSYTPFTGENIGNWEKIKSLTADRDRLQEEKQTLKAQRDKYRKNLDLMTADSDRWKALAVELREAMEHEVGKGEETTLRQRILNEWISIIKNEQEALNDR